MSGCTGAVDPNVSFLSFSLPSLKSTGTSPFQQELSSQGYIELQGTCDKAVTDFQFQMDRNGWKNVSSSPTMAPPGVTPPSKPYDVDCSDGTFYIYLFESDIQAYLPAGASLENYDPSAVHLRGIAGPFATEALTFYNSDRGPELEANSFVLRPLSSRFAVNLCMPVDLWLVHVENGSTSWSGRVSSSQDRKIGLSWTDATTTEVKFYSGDDCNTGPVSEILIPKGETSARVYIKGTATGEGRISGAGVGFGGAGVEPAFFVRIDAATGPSDVKFSDLQRRPDVGSCEKVTVLLTDSNEVVTGGVSTELTVSVSGPEGVALSGVTLFDGPHCDGAASAGHLELTFPVGANPWREISYKVADSSSKALFASSPLLPAAEPARHYINPWLAAHQVVLSSSLAAGLSYQAPDCIKITATLMDRNGYPQNTIEFPSEFDYTVVDHTGTASLYDNDACGGTGETERSVSFAAGEFAKSVFLKLGVTSQASGLSLSGVEYIPPNSPSRLEKPFASSLEIPVVANLNSMGGTMQRVFRLPRSPLAGPASLSSVGAVKDLTAYSYQNQKMSAFYDDTSPLAVYMTEGGGRVIGQQVWDLHGGDGFAINSPSLISLLSGYMTAIMFRSNSAGTQSLMGFTEVPTEQYVLAPNGSVQFMGCSLGSGLNDGQWHTLIVSRPPLSPLGGSIYYKVDGASAQECTVSASFAALLPNSFTQAFSVGKWDTGPGLDGQVAEVLFDDSQWVMSTNDSLFSKIHQHLLNRYPQK